jgi:hypothetical protein
LTLSQLARRPTTSRIVAMFILHAFSTCSWYPANVFPLSFCIVCI